MGDVAIDAFEIATTNSDAPFLGSGEVAVVDDAVAMAATPSGRGYWVAAAGSSILSIGDASFHGGAENLNAPITDLVATLRGRGYWLVASDGGVFAMGDAPFFGSAVSRS